MTEASHAVTSYRTYWISWACLLALTIIMIYVPNFWMVLTGITIKAAVISLVFMHLNHERTDFMLTVLLGIFLTSLVLFGLMIPDGIAM